MPPTKLGQKINELEKILMAQSPSRMVFGLAQVQRFSQASKSLGGGGVIGAGAVVTKSTEPNGLYLGVPAKRVKDLEV